MFYSQIARNRGRHFFSDMSFISKSPPVAPLWYNVLLKLWQFQNLISAWVQDHRVREAAPFLYDSVSENAGRYTINLSSSLQDKAD